LVQVWAGRHHALPGEDKSTSAVFSREIEAFLSGAGIGKLQEELINNGPVDGSAMTERAVRNLHSQYFSKIAGLLGHVRSV
jgi:hypothetical protein